MVYRLKVAGIERDLPLCPIGENLYIGAFIMFGDVELTEKCAAELIAKAFLSATRCAASPVRTAIYSQESRLSSI